MIFPNYYPRVVSSQDTNKILNNNLEGIIVDLQFYQWMKTRKSKIVEFVEGNLRQKKLVRDENEILSIIQEFNEDELIKKVVKPLLRKMGFKNVKKRDYHGAGELGRDILPFFKEREFGEREYMAAQVKSEKIHSNATIKEGNINSIIRQIDSALSASFFDDTDNTWKKIDHIYLITSKEITDDAEKVFSGTFQGKRDVILINGQKLAHGILEHNILFGEREVQESTTYQKKVLILDPCTDCLFQEPKRRANTVKNYLGFSEMTRNRLRNDEKIMEEDFEEDNEIREYIISCFEGQRKLGATILLTPYIPTVSPTWKYFDITPRILELSSKLHSENMPYLYGVLCLSEAFLYNSPREKLIENIEDIDIEGYAIYVYDFIDYRADTPALKGYIKLVNTLKKLGKKVIVFYSSAFGLVLALYGADIISSGVLYVERRKKGEARPEEAAMSLTDPRRRYYVRPLLSQCVATEVESVLEEINYSCDCEDCKAWNIPHPQASMLMDVVNLGRHFIHEKLREIEDLRTQIEKGQGFKHMETTLMRAYEFAQKIERKDIDIGVRRPKPTVYLNNWYLATLASEELL